MFFALSKTIGIFLVPSNFVATLGVVGAGMLFTRFAGIGRNLVVASFALFALIGVLPMRNALLYTLENRFPPWGAKLVVRQIDTLATQLKICSSCSGFSASSGNPGKESAYKLAGRLRGPRLSLEL